MRYFNDDATPIAIFETIKSYISNINNILTEVIAVDIFKYQKLDGKHHTKVEQKTFAKKAY